MPMFEYQARDRLGRIVTGKRLAQSTDNLSLQLSKENITPIRITKAGQRNQLWQELTDLFGGKRVDTDELSMFSRQMHTLCKAGVPITNALRQLGENARSAHMSVVLQEVVESLESGQNLSDAMNEHPEVFSPIMVNMVKVGQNTGHLDEAFLRLNQYLELEDTAIKRTRVALRYPALIFSTIIIAVIIVNALVIPTFANVFKQAHLTLPLETQILISISDFVTHEWYLMLAMVVGAILAIYYYLKKPEGQLKWHQFQLHIPGVGGIIRRIILLRFAQAFSIVVSSGVPILDGITLVAQSISNVYASKEILSIRDAIQHGKSLTQAVAVTELFTPLEIQMIAVSEETGELASMLDHVAAYYRREVDYDLKRLSDVIEPVLIVGLALLILLLAFAVYLPVWNMVRMVHN